MSQVHRWGGMGEVDSGWGRVRCGGGEGGKVWQRPFQAGLRPASAGYDCGTDLFRNGVRWSGVGRGK